MCSPTVPDNVETTLASALPLIFVANALAKSASAISSLAAKSPKSATFALAA